MRPYASPLGFLCVLIALCLPAPTASAAKDGEAFQPEPGSTVIELGGKAEAVRTGGAGRYLVFRFKDAERLTVVDVVAGRVLKQVPAPGEFHYAANRDKLLIVLNGQHVVQRWDFKTLEREKTALLDTDEVVKAVAMGDAGAGPLAVWSGGKVRFFDVESLKPLDIAGEVVSQPGGVNLWPSADGLTFTAFGWTTGQIPVMRLSGVTATSAVCVTKPSNAWTVYNQAWAAPGPDGSFLIGSNGVAAMFGADGLTQLDTKQFDRAFLYPTEDPRFVLSVRRQEGKSTGKAAGKPNTVAVVAAVDRRVLYTVGLPENVTGGQIGTEVGRLGAEPRVRLLTKERLLVTIPEDNDKVVVRPFDVGEKLKETGADYLFVVSRPPEKLRSGETLRYQVEALSRAGGLKYKVEDGPDGLAVSPAGLVTWAAGGPGRGGKVGVVLAVSDAGGQEVNHAFDVQLVRDVPPPGGPVAAGADGVIELWPESAVLRGERLAIDKDGSVGAWNRREDYVEWVAAPAAAGWFEVEVVQGSGDPGGEYEVVAGDRKVAAKVQRTGGFKDFKAVRVGAVQLPAEKVTVAVRPTAIRGYLMDLKAVRLIPTTAPPAGWAGAGGAAAVAEPAAGGAAAGAAGAGGAAAIDLPPSDRLVVANALWGSGDRWVDVTDKVRGAVRAGRVDLRAADDPLGDGAAETPAAGRKELVVVYRDRAGGHIARFAEGERAVIRPAARPGPGGGGGPPGPGKLGAAARLVGAWEAAPALDDAKVRALLKDKNVAPDQMAAAAAKFRQSMAGLKMTYTFNADGSAAATIGTPADLRPTKGKWEVVRETAKGAVVRYAPEGESPDELEVMFDGPDRFAAPPPATAFPVVSPLEFRRAGPPATAPAAPAGKGG